MDERDEDQWLDDPIVHALRAPGTESELAGEAEFVALFRANAARGGSVRRLIGRVGLGATTAVTTVVLSAGVAAAYTQVLPDPVQRIAHSLLGPVGVRGPSSDRRPTVVSEPKADRSTRTPEPTRTPTSAPTSAPTSTPTPTPGPLPTPSATARPLPPTSATAVPTPTTTPTSTATATPTAPVGRPVPAALSVVSSSRHVRVGNSVVVSGIVTGAGQQPLPGRAVRLVERRTASSWTLVASGRTGKDGRVSLTTPALTESAVLQLRTGYGVRSAVVPVVVVPVVSVALSEGAGTSSLNVTVRGGEPGDQVVLLVRRSNGLVQLDSGVLDATGAVTFSRRTPRYPVRLVVRVVATKRHTSAQATVTVGAAG